MKTKAVMVKLGFVVVRLWLRAGRACDFVACLGRTMRMRCDRRAADGLKRIGRIERLTIRHGEEIVGTLGPEGYRDVPSGPKEVQ